MRVKGVKRGLPFAHDTKIVTITTRSHKRAEQRNLRPVRSKPTGPEEITQNSGLKRLNAKHAAKLKVKALTSGTHRAGPVPHRVKLAQEESNNEIAIEIPIVESIQFKTEPPALEEIRIEEDGYPVSLDESIAHLEKLIALQSDNTVEQVATEKPARSKRQGRLQSSKTANSTTAAATSDIRILEFYEHLTFNKYKPAPGAVKIDPTSMNVACRVFGTERAIELGLVGRQKGGTGGSSAAAKTAKSKPKIRLGKRSMHSEKPKQKKRQKMSNKKWSGTCHVFYVDSANSRNWKPSPEGSSGGSSVHIVDDLIRTFQNDKIVEEINLTNESIVACTSPKFVQLNATDNGTVWGFGFRKEDDRQSFQNCLNTIVEQAKTALKQATVDDNKLKDENDRLRQRQLLKEDEIKDLREKKLKLELEIKEKNQRERILQKRGDELQERNEKLEEEVCRMRQLLKDAEEEIRTQDQRLVQQRIVQDPVFIKKVSESAKLLSGAMKMLSCSNGDVSVGPGIAKTEQLDEVPIDNFSKM